MLRNYFKTAWRNLLKNKSLSALHIVGLSLGMSIVLLIALWVFNEYSYDRFLPDYQQAYQVEMNIKFQQDEMRTQTDVSVALVDVLKKDFPEIQYVAESDDMSDHGLQVGEKKIYSKGMAVGVDFLKILEYPLLKGRVEDIFKDPFSIVLTCSLARTLFGNEDPIGKTVKIDADNNVKVTGVMEDIPANSTLQFNYLFPFSFLEKTQEWMKTARTDWGNNSYSIFVRLYPSAVYSRLAPRLKNVVYDHSPIMRNIKPEIFLHPVKYWHLYSTFRNGRIAGGFIDYVRMFSIIGVLVLIIACINFINLSTARSEKRAREVGIRKVMGSQRRELIFQFLTESILLTFLAFVLSIALVQLALPSFNNLTNNSIRIPYGNLFFWSIMIAYVVLTGILAGIRPAFYLSSFNPVKVLKGKMLMGKAATLPRKVMVVLQFTCSIGLIISTLIVYRQIQYAKARPIGYDVSRVMMTDMNGDLNNNYDALRNELMGSGMVENVTKASSKVTDLRAHMVLKDWPDKPAGDGTVNIGVVLVSENYFTALGMQLIEGNGFGSSWKDDTAKVILNEAAVKRIGLKDPINRVITWNGTPTQVRIVGVVKNALMESPFKPVGPTVFYHADWGNVILYRLRQNVDTREAIATIEKIFNKYNPSYPYSYVFADDEYNHKFTQEVLVGKLVGVFAGLAIFISCLGLFGLATYVAERRGKEIGVRKVLGASVLQVWVLLSKEFVLLTFLSAVIASPIAFYVLGNWLHNYDYRITVGPGVFLFAGALALLITLFTVSYQAIKAAVTSPIKRLRDE
ncbi:MAG TPA: ABC transporter permease [Puia sp.]|nr:ABC transporter permease [Puia sp.]